MMNRSTSELPAHLAGHEPRGLVEHEVIAQFELGSYRNFIYLILDWESREAAIVDPQKDLAPPLEALKKHGFRLTRILLTHSHHDHIAGVPELVRDFPGVPVHVGRADEHRLGSGMRPGEGFGLLEDGQLLKLGKLSIEVLHTPGHSAGEFCYLVRAAGRPYLCTGDTIFIRDCGRTDLESGSTAEMFASIQRIKRLPPETVFLPGHHYAPECATTLAAELEKSPPFRCRTVEELQALP